MNSYEVIGKKLLKLIEENKSKWEKPWSCPPIGSLENYVTHHRYTRGNIWILMLVSWLEGYPTNQYLTYKQCSEIGEHVLEGQSGYPVLYWNETEKKDASGRVIMDSKGDPEKIGYIRYYTVFNVWQTSLKDKIILKIEKRTDNEIIENCERIIQGYKTKPRIESRENNFEAYYSLTTDEIHVPAISLFKNSQEYYSTLFHECIHSTAHPNRLYRQLSEKAIEREVEELTAETGAFLLNGEAGISTTKNNVAYLSHWLKAINNDAKSFLFACGKAVDAVEYILHNNQKKEVQN